MLFAITFVLFQQLRVVPAANKQLQRTVIRRHVRAASASPHCAHAARFMRQSAAAELRRWADNN
jgi:hypothetical protein